MIKSQFEIMCIISCVLCLLLIIMSYISKMDKDLCTVSILSNDKYHKVVYTKSAGLTHISSSSKREFYYYGDLGYQC